MKNIIKKNKKGNIGINKIIIITLIVLTLFLVFSLIFKLNPFGIFNFLPTFTPQENGEELPPQEIPGLNEEMRQKIITECTTVAKVGPPENTGLAHILVKSQQYIHNEKGERTNLYWNSKDSEIKLGRYSGWRPWHFYRNYFEWGDIPIGRLFLDTKTGFMKIEIYDGFILDGENSFYYRKYEEDFKRANVDFSLLNSLHHSSLLNFAGNTLSKCLDEETPLPPEFNEELKQKIITECVPVANVGPPSRAFLRSPKQYIYNASGERTNLYWNSKDSEIKLGRYSGWRPWHFYRNYFEWGDIPIGRLFLDTKTGFMKIEIYDGFILDGENSFYYRKYEEDFKRANVNFSLLNSLHHSSLLNFAGNTLSKCLDEEDENLTKMKEIVNYAKINLFMNRRCDCGDLCDLYSELILKSANNRGIDPLLLLSIAIWENNCRWDAKGKSVGIMQIYSWEECESELDLLSIEDLRGKENIEKNIECGAIILRKKYDSFRKGRYFTNHCSREEIPYYVEWDAALRGYVGWGCAPGHDYYVENVNFIYEKLKEIS